MILPADRKASAVGRGQRRMLGFSRCVLTGEKIRSGPDLAATGQADVEEIEKKVKIVGVCCIVRANE